MDLHGKPKRKTTGKREFTIMSENYNEFSSYPAITSSRIFCNQMPTSRIFCNQEPIPFSMEELYLYPSELSGYFGST